MKCEGNEYIVAVDGEWIGKFKKHNMMPVFHPTVRCSVEDAEKLAEGLKGQIEIFETWGSFPEHRKVVKTIVRETGRKRTYDDYWEKEGD